MKDDNMDLLLNIDKKLDEILSLLKHGNKNNSVNAYCLSETVQTNDKEYQAITDIRIKIPGQNTHSNVMSIAGASQDDVLKKSTLIGLEQILQQVSMTHTNDDKEINIYTNYDIHSNIKEEDHLYEKYQIINDCISWVDNISLKVIDLKDDNVSNNDLILIKKDLENRKNECLTSVDTQSSAKSNQKNK